jgi:hypothetical protein
MTTYKALTKVIKDKNGNERIACSFYGTGACQTEHATYGCGSCPVLGAILNQLHTFEEIYLEETKQGE